uniref:NADH dehydrogenase subunit 6 n=1 Tax=Dermatobranchus otome TaxID=1504997 RepID=UPI001FF29CA7|nr:NADH dehydrogenase subunit 6 [Dermatobranchus otome]UOD76582.1 NADH dehydrogenase subunit 6 [Dermatobranchus otome]UOD76595.1 NADH dehydrogenase subunit 6 [Dermatobranchus otome]
MFLFTFFVFLMLCFPLFYSPVSMVGMLMAISISIVGLFSFFGSFWYSYILFLIYVGGLLVLLIYICLVSSNYPIKLSPSGIVFVVFGSLIASLMSSWVSPKGFLGSSCWGSGMSLVEGSNVSIFLFLVVLLLAMLLVVVRVSGIGSSIVVNEKT